MNGEEGRGVGMCVEYMRERGSRLGGSWCVCVQNECEFGVLCGGGILREVFCVRVCVGCVSVCV